MKRPSEKQLTRALEEKLATDAAFVEWLLSRTNFAGRRATYRWSRSDSPWSTVRFMAPHPDTGVMKPTSRQSETDLLAVFDAADGNVIALHIEIKLSTGRFTRQQPEQYPLRAEQWKGEEKYGSYTEFDTVLVAPQVFIERNSNQAKQFGSVVTHEDIARFITAYGSPVLFAIQQQFHALIRERAAEFSLVLEPNLPLPELAALQSSGGGEAWFPVPGMYGGFAYSLEEGARMLVTSSWSRVCEGSGRRHEINPDGCRLVAEGFV